MKGWLLEAGKPLPECGGFLRPTRREQMVLVLRNLHVRDTVEDDFRREAEFSGQTALCAIPTQISFPGP